MFLCQECRSECDSCFAKNFCTRCRAGFFLHLGKCQETCPEGLVRNEAQRECAPSKNPNAFLGWLLLPKGQIRLSVVVFAECPADCESCVNGDTCTRCRQGLYLLSGRCHHVCPEDYEPSDKLMECTLQGQSELKVPQKLQKSRMTEESFLLGSLLLSLSM